MTSVNQNKLTLPLALPSSMEHPLPLYGLVHPRPMPDPHPRNPAQAPGNIITTEPCRVGQRFEDPPRPSVHPPLPHQDRRGLPNRVQLPRAPTLSRCEHALRNGAPRGDPDPPGRQVCQGSHAWSINKAEAQTLPALHINRIGVIPKGHNTGRWRFITDLSYPPGESINDGIAPELCLLTYTSVEKVAEAATWYGRGALIAKIDIESAYMLILVHPTDRQLQVMEWKG